MIKKKIIGIVARDEIINNIKIQGITKNNLQYLNNKCSFIGILNYDNNHIDKEVLKICDGIIIPGGCDIYPYHFEIVDYAIKNHIPLLGICMGHQIIGLYANKQKEKHLLQINNHYIPNSAHNINIAKNSNLYKIIKQDNIFVNSRHLYMLNKIKKPFKVSAISDDNVIEAIEYIDEDNFILGLQWHPEDMDNMNIIYDEFIKRISKN